MVLQPQEPIGRIDSDELSRLAIHEQRIRDRLSRDADVIRLLDEDKDAVSKIVETYVEVDSGFTDEQRGIANRLVRFAGYLASSVNEAQPDEGDPYLSTEDITALQGMVYDLLDIAEANGTEREISTPTFDDPRGGK